MEPDFTITGPPLPPTDQPLPPLARQVLGFGWRLPWLAQPLAVLEALFLFCVDTLGAARCHLVFAGEDGRGAYVRDHPESTTLPVALADPAGGLVAWMRLTGGGGLDLSGHPGLQAPAELDPAVFDAAFALGGLCFPLTVGERLAGMLVLPGWKLGTEEKAWLGFLAGQTSQVLTRIEMTEDVEFLGRISRGLAHDVQGALTPVGTFLQLAACGERYVPKLAALLPTATAGYAKVQEILRQAVGLSRGEALSFSTVSLGAVAREAFAALRAQAEAGRVEMVLDAPAEVQVRAEPVLLLRLFLNLLSNALAASPPDRQVRVEVATNPEGQGIARIVDEGAGISAENLRRAGHTEPREAASAPGGPMRGLGLATSRRLIRRLEGRLGFDGRSGQGTTVTVALPLA